MTQKFNQASQAIKDTVVRVFANDGINSFTLLSASTGVAMDNLVLQGKLTLEQGMDMG